jgi:hypothetical protein
MRIVITAAVVLVLGGGVASAKRDQKRAAERSEGTAPTWRDPCSFDRDDRLATIAPI